MKRRISVTLSENETADLVLRQLAMDEIKAISSWTQLAKTQPDLIISHGLGVRLIRQLAMNNIIIGIPNAHEVLSDGMLTDDRFKLGLKVSNIRGMDREAFNTINTGANEVLRSHAVFIEHLENPILAFSNLCKKISKMHAVLSDVATFIDYGLLSKLPNSGRKNIGDIFDKCEKYAERLNTHFGQCIGLANALVLAFTNSSIVDATLVSPTFQTWSTLISSLQGHEEALLRLDLISDDDQKSCDRISGMSDEAISKLGAYAHLKELQPRIAWLKKAAEVCETFLRKHRLSDDYWQKVAERQDPVLTTLLTIYRDYPFGDKGAASLYLKRPGHQIVELTQLVRPENRIFVDTLILRWHAEDAGQFPFLRISHEPTTESTLTRREGAFPARETRPELNALLIREAAGRKATIESREANIARTETIKRERAEERRQRWAVQVAEAKSRTVAEQHIFKAEVLPRLQNEHDLIRAMIDGKLSYHRINKAWQNLQEKFGEVPSNINSDEYREFSKQFNALRIEVEGLKSVYESAHEKLNRTISKDIDSRTKEPRKSDSRTFLLNNATDPALRVCVAYLYRPMKSGISQIKLSEINGPVPDAPSKMIGDGGTASALIYEGRTGDYLSPRSHYYKAVVTLQELERIHNTEVLSPMDEAICHRLISDLETALDRFPIS